MKARKIVMACCHLHNYLCSKNKAKYLQLQDIERYDIVTGAMEPGSWRQDIQDMVGESGAERADFDKFSYDSDKKSTISERSSSS